MGSTAGGDNDKPDKPKPRKRRMMPGRPIEGQRAIRRLIFEHLPPEVAAIYSKAPELNDPAWQGEFGRALFALYLDAQHKALTATRASEQRRWHKVAKAQAEELRKLKYLEAQQKADAVPRDFLIGVAGMDEPEATEGFDPGKADG